MPLLADFVPDRGARQGLDQHLFFGLTNQLDSQGVARDVAFDGVGGILNSCVGQNRVTGNAEQCAVDSL